MCTPQGNYEELSFEHFDSSDGLVNDMVQSIIEDREGNLWMATEYGISRFNPEKRTFENFFFSSSTFSPAIFPTPNSACSFALKAFFSLICNFCLIFWPSFLRARASLRWFFSNLRVAFLDDFAIADVVCCGCANGFANAINKKDQGQFSLAMDLRKLSRWICLSPR